MPATIIASVATAPSATDGIDIDNADTYLNLTGASGSYASTPDAAALDITGDLELVMRVSVNTWAGADYQTLMAKWNGAGNNSFLWDLEIATGKMRLVHTSDGTTSKVDTSTVSLPSVGAANGSAYWLKVTLDVDNGAAGRTTTFYWSYDNETEPLLSQWFTLGTAVTTAGVSSVFSGNGALYIGGRQDTTSFTTTGKVYMASVRSGIGLALGSFQRLTADFQHQTAGATSFTAGTGQTVTVNSPATLTADPNGWRLAVQVLVSSGGARVGKGLVDSARVSDYQWFDLTGSLIGIEWVRGRPATGAGYPRPDVGVLSMSLDNSSNEFSAWLARSYTAGSVNNPALNREWVPKAIVRVVMFKANATSATYTPGNGYTHIYRGHWKPLFTGYVESWDERIDQGRNTVAITAVETLSFFAGINKAAQASQGAGETLLARLARLTNDAGWAFPISQGRYFNDYTNDALYTLQATTMAANRLAEIYLSGDSIFATLLYTDTDGSLRVGFGEYAEHTGLTYISVSPTIVRLTSSTKTLASDNTAYPKMVTAYYQPPLVINNNADFVLNYISATRVGGSEQVSQTAESQGLYGLRSLKRTDLICTFDTQALGYNLWLLSDLDAYVAPSYPTAALMKDVEQSLQPGRVTLVDQQTAQRALNLWDLCVLDYYRNSSSTVPDVRMLSRIVEMRHTITRLSKGIHWETNISLLSRSNYKMTS